MRIQKQKKQYTFSSRIMLNSINRRLNNPPNLIINRKVVPYENKAKYLDMTLDSKLKWKEHIRTSLDEIEL